jgi:hypothetical protein
MTFRLCGKIAGSSTRRGFRAPPALRNRCGDLPSADGFFEQNFDHGGLRRLPSKLPVTVIKFLKSEVAGDRQYCSKQYPETPSMDSVVELQRLERNSLDICLLTAQPVWLC